MDFKQRLKHWNNGIERGAQTRLARTLGIAPNTVSQWVNLGLTPGEELLRRIAKLFQVTDAEAARMFAKEDAPLDAYALAAKVADLERRIAALEGRHGSATGPEAWSGAAMHEDLIGPGAPPAKATPPKTKGRSGRR